MTTVFISPPHLKIIICSSLLIFRRSSTSLNVCLSISLHVHNSVETWPHSKLEQGSPCLHAIMSLLWWKMMHAVSWKSVWAAHKNFAVLVWGKVRVRAHFVATQLHYQEPYLKWYFCVHTFTLEVYGKWKDFYHIEF